MRALVVCSALLGAALLLRTLLGPQTGAEVERTVERTVELKDERELRRGFGAKPQRLAEPAETELGSAASAALPSAEPERLGRAREPLGLGSISAVSAMDEPLGEPLGDPLNEPVQDAPLFDQPKLPEQREPWRPSRSEEKLRDHGLLGLYTGWLNEAERLGWEASRESLSISRDGVELRFMSRDGMLLGAEAELPPNALSESVMDLWLTLLGREGAYLSLEPPFERQTPGWRETRSVPLPSGRTVELSLTGRSEGEAPFGPARLELKVSELLR